MSAPSSSIQEPSRDSSAFATDAAMTANSQRRFSRRPGFGWKHIAGSVWDHETGLRIHLLGMARMPDGKIVSWNWEDEYAAKRQQGYNAKRAMMVWSLSLLSTP